LVVVHMLLHNMYFAHARYLEAIPEPAGYLDNLFNIEEYCDDDDDVDD